MEHDTRRYFKISGISRRISGDTLSSWRESFSRRVEKIINSFSFVEKIVFYGFASLLVLSAVLLLLRLNNSFLVDVPARGGSIIEGVAGSPRFINPLLAISDADRDLTSLVYSGLLRATPEGDLIPDLAEKYEISDDGLEYTFTLRRNAEFHDKTPVTADDVLYTVLLAQDPSLKSQKRANWEGVLAEKMDDYTIRFTLPEEYSPFLENATLGILPKHVWEGTPPEQHPFSPHNVEPIGSGPYVFENLTRSKEGIPEEYKLSSFKKYLLGEPFIPSITFLFYANEDELVRALLGGSVDQGSSLSPENAVSLREKGVRVENFPLPRVFGVFFNQSRAPLFALREVRLALDKATDRLQIIDEVLHGYGTALGGPLPRSVTKEDGSLDFSRDVAGAESVLQNNGWERDEAKEVLVKETRAEDYTLSFTLKTANAPELKKTAEILKQSWERIGARVTIELFDTGNLSNQIIRPREYGALLFGQVTGRNLDPFAFWHSSQRNDPGLNIALYANISADDILEEIRKTHNRSELGALYEKLEAEIKNDVPAVFLYAPDFIYAVHRDLRGFRPGIVTTSADRFLSVHEWHIQTEKVWKIFAS